MIALLCTLALQSPATERLLPRLAPEATITLAAAWEPCRRSKYGLFDETEVLRSPEPAEQRHTYAAAELARFLPPGPVAVGDTWPVPREAVIPFLRQFHAGARSELHSTADEGTFACLRAASNEHLEILFRAHAEFQLTPEVVYTPAQFEGRLLLDRAQGLPLALSIALPDRDTNVDVNVAATSDDSWVDAEGNPVSMTMYADIGWVSRMALTSPAAPAQEWTDSIPDADARLRLARCFYPFAELEWLPFSEAMERAREREKPVLVVLLFGTLDDESC